MEHIFQVKVDEVVRDPGLLPHSDAELRELFDKHGSLPLKPLYRALKQAIEADADTPPDERASKYEDIVEELKEHRKSCAYDAFWATYNQYVSFVYPAGAAAPAPAPAPVQVPVQEQPLIPDEEIPSAQAEQYFGIFKDSCLDPVRGRGLRMPR